MIDVDYTFMIAGIKIPIDSLHVTSGSYGSIGHMIVSCDISYLDDNKIDLFQMSSQANGSLEVDLQVSVSGVKTKLFGGEYLDARWLYDQDKVEIHARDWAGVLVDQKRIPTDVVTSITSVLTPLAPGQTVTPGSIKTQNQQLAAIVQSIANQFGLTPVFKLRTGGLPPLGSLYGSGDTVFQKTPQTLWSILCQIARDTGYEVFVTPNKELVFGEPGQFSTPITISWGDLYDITTTSVVPGTSLVISHSPRRNSTFRVLVFSYDPALTQITIGRATVVGANLAGSAGLKPGIWLGADAVTADGKLGIINDTARQVPLYSFHIDGLTAAQASAKASAIATDISKRELILECSVDILPGLSPMQAVTLKGSKVSPHFTGNTFYINSFSHTFSMSNRNGSMTSIRALDVPIEGTGSSNGGPLL